MPTKNEISDFSDLINELSVKEGISRLEAIVYHCEKTGLEVDVAASLISSALKSKLREEAQEANLLKKTSRLPV